MKQKLQSGSYTAGVWASLGSPMATEVVGQMGFDWILIDMEHGPGDYQTLLGQLQAIAAAGDSVPVVRAQWNDPVVVKRILDMGAAGVMIPGVGSVEEAEKAVAAVKYPPEGIRGIAGVRCNKWGMDTEYLKEANSNIMLFLQFETKGAVENAEKILSLPGIDVAFIGPHDLSASLGHTGELSHPDVLQAIERIEKAAQANNIPLGTITRNAEDAARLIDKGYQALTLGADFGYIMKGARESLKQFSKHPRVSG